jgi:hypothetical protein
MIMTFMFAFWYPELGESSGIAYGMAYLHITESFHSVYKLSRARSE